MLISDYLRIKNMTIYRLSKNTQIPYATLNDICNGKTSLEKCSAETVWRIAKGLDIPMEDLLRSYMVPRCSFELFKSNVCHKLKALGDIGFLLETLRDNQIREYYHKKWYQECFYLLAMLDTVSKENNFPLCEEYDDLRKQKLDSMLFPDSVIALSVVQNSEQPKEDAIREALPEFLKYNIIESDIRNVI